jgi:hypothetical protein
VVDISFEKDVCGQKNGTFVLHTKEARAREPLRRSHLRKDINRGAAKKEGERDRERVFVFSVLLFGKGGGRNLLFCNIKQERGGPS